MQEFVEYEYVNVIVVEIPSTASRQKFNFILLSFLLMSKHSFMTAYG
jgi:hypothetical protein